MLPYRRQMSYDSLKYIVTHLQLSQRLELSFLFRIIHNINRHISFSVSFLKFHQKYSIPGLTTGILFVDSVVYIFESIGLYHVGVQCMDRRIVSSDKHLANRYFEYFLRSSVLPVQQLELIQCEKQFHNFHGIPIPRLKIQSQPDIIATIQGLPTGHRMEIVELIDSRPEYVEDVNISAARLIKFSTKLEKHENSIDPPIIRLIRALVAAGTKTELRIKMNDVDAFSCASVILLCESIKIGSHVTGVFDETLEVYNLYVNLFNFFREYFPRFTTMNGKECVVLRETETFTTVAFRDYFNTDSIENCISFTSINIPSENIPRRHELTIYTIDEE